jgi:1-deoxy-D-xylulose-5-phosphate synthase
MMDYAGARNGPTLIRYPRGALSSPLPVTDESITIAQIFDGAEWALLGHGVAVHTLIEVRERTQEWEGGLPLPAVYDIRRLKPLDGGAIDKILRRFSLVAVAEENYMSGGLGEAVAARIAEGRHRSLLRRFGVPDVCVPHATSEEQRAMYGITAGNILDVCSTALKTQIR